MKFKILCQIALVSASLLPAWSAGEFSTCKDHIARQEVEKGIPQDCLKAIAMVESRMSPWAVNAQGRARFFESKEAAAKFIRGLLDQGVGNIGVGCMQLHYASHHRHFKSVEEMLEPEKNIAHAAKLLRNLERRHGSLERAVKMYHSASPAYHNPYKNRVYSAWAKIRGKNQISDAMLKPATLQTTGKISNKPAPKFKFGVGGAASKKNGKR